MKPADQSGTACDLLVVRHAETDDNVEGRVQGWIDNPLSVTGRRQAAAAGRSLAATAGARIFDAIVASDLERAAHTAQLIAAEFGWDRARVQVDPRLREYHTGLWSGLTTDEIEARWPGQLTLWQARQLPAPPGGEDRGTFASRIRNALRDIVERQPGGKVLVVGHGGLLRMMERRGGLPARPFANLSGRWVMARLPAYYQLGQAVELAHSAPVVMGEVS
jgi:broad specificity phosphatase PhoE